jgi:hypothetical protein
VFFSLFAYVQGVQRLASLMTQHRDGARERAASDGDACDPVDSGPLAQGVEHEFRGERVALCPQNRPFAVDEKVARFTGSERDLLSLEGVLPEQVEKRWTSLRSSLSA